MSQLCCTLNHYQFSIGKIPTITSDKQKPNLVNWRKLLANHVKYAFRQIQILTSSFRDIFSSRGDSCFWQSTLWSDCRWHFDKGRQKTRTPKKLRQVLQKAEDVALSFNKKTCKVNKWEVEHAGHIFSSDLIKLSSEEIKAILVIPAAEYNKRITKIQGHYKLLRKVYSEFV